MKGSKMDIAEWLKNSFKKPRTFSDTVKQLAVENTELRAKVAEFDKCNGWVSVEDRLPENDKQVMAWVKDKSNLYGGYRQLVNYGKFSFCVPYGDTNDYPDMDEDGEVRRFGWHYERDSEGEFENIVFDLNGKVTHWTPVIDRPEVKG